MPSRFVPLVLVCAAVIAATGCNSQQDATHANFSVAIARHLERQKELCLGLSGWPIELPEWENLKRDAPTGTARKMEALISAGLVAEQHPEAASPHEKPRRSQAGAQRYVLTDRGQSFNREAEVHSYSFTSSPKTTVEGDLCYGKKSLDRIVKWEGPVKSGDDRTAKVTYLYKIENLASWADQLDIQRAFPEISRIIAGASKQEDARTVVLTRTGWEVGHWLN